ncbi:MAG: M23 family metallopeptidase [Bacteroidetes bacterium]|nr:M23 family metallopeptidase [Bacteroidota bacterium]
MSDPKIRITNQSFDNPEDGIKIHSSSQDDQGKDRSWLLFLKKYYLLLLGVLLGFILISVVVYISTRPDPENERNYTPPVVEPDSSIDYRSQEVDKRESFFGFVLDDFEDPVYLVYQKGAASPRDMIAKQGLSSAELNRVLSSVPNMDLLRNPPVNSKIAFLKKRGEKDVSYFIFEPDPYEYWVFGLKDSLYFEEVKRDIRTEEESLNVRIENSLKTTIERKRLMPDSIGLLLDSALAWTVDLYHLPENSKIKFIYKENYIDNALKSVGPLDAVLLETPGREYYAFRFYHNHQWNYIDQNGNFLKNSFLKAPVNYSRISSKFGLRPHPIQEKTKFHYGTDYAAKAGSPIMAVADGEVVDARYREHNGYYVKLKHDNGYETLYLHMQENSFPPKVRPGYRVRQGETIGLVGQTGDATGPHVCFHIRKDKEPIDPEQVKLPGPVALEGEERERFLILKDSLVNKLQKITYSQ